MIATRYARVDGSRVAERCDRCGTVLAVHGIVFGSPAVFPVGRRGEFVPDETICESCDEAAIAIALEYEETT